MYNENPQIYWLEDSVPYSTIITRLLFLEDLLPGMC